MKKEMLKNKNNLIIGLFAVVILMGIGFAAYSQRLTINETSNVTTNWNVYISDANVKEKSESVTANASVTDRETATLTTELKYPGDKAVYNITVKNEGTIDAILEKIEVIKQNEKAAINYEVEGITENEDLLTNESKNFTITVEYDRNKKGTLTEEEKNNTLMLKLEWSQKSEEVLPVQTASEYLIAKNEMVVDTKEEGRYIYKGESPNNYIKFNDELWRIVAVENDNTLKIIKDEKLSVNKVFDSRSSETTGRRLNANNTYCRLWTDGIYYGCNAWNAVTGTYVNNSFNGTVTDDSEMKTYLNGEYYNGLSAESKSQIQTHTFKKGGVLWGTTVGNIKAAEDKDSWTGNVALLNLSDWYNASSNAECTDSLNDWYTEAKGYIHENYKCSFDNYLYKSGYWWWLLPPYGRYPYDVLSVRGAGCVHGHSSSDGGAVRPVLFLKSNTILDKTTDGSMDNPYKIVS